MRRKLHSESITLVNRERITLRLYGTDDGLMLERELAELDGSSLIQVLPVACTTTIRAFFSADPYQTQIDACFWHFYAKADAYLGQTSANDCQ